MSFPLNELNLLLIILLSAAAVLVLILAYKIRLLQKDYDRLLHENKEDSRILFLKSRYASMGETVGNIAHQWKQPLNAIGSIQNSIKAALIFKGEISKEKLLHSVETSFKLLQHLAETIDTFYSFLAQQGDDKRSFVVADELEKVRKITEYSFENSHITLNYELEINPTIQGNANEFTHAILNLILNAKDAFDGVSVDAPLITVRVSDGDQTCHITVTDNAGGIRLKPVDMVFDLHTTTKEEGSGLGLFMTKNIIENRFGGKISVKNVEGGACFTILLPYAEYGEHCADTLTPDERLTLDRINQLSRKIIELEEVEKALKKWADIFEQAQWGIVMCGADTMTLDLMNPAFAQMHGFEVDELVKKPIESIFAPEYRDDVQCILHTVHQESHYAFESVHIRKDGSRFPVAIDITAVKDDNDNVLYRIANVRDITAFKEAEEKLLLKQFALDTINEAVYLIDENSMFYYVNDGACKALGYAKEELLAMGVVDIDPNCSVGWWGIHWEDIKRHKTVLGQASHRKKDGSVFPIEVSSNYFEYNGVGYSLAVARDITERLQLEAQKDNERMCLFFERQLVGMAITSPEYGWLHTNEKLQQMLGYTHEELNALTWVEMTYHEDLAPDVEQFERLLRGEIEDYMLEKRFIRKDGSIVYTNLAVSCVRNDDRSVNYVLALLEDITERKSAEKALLEKTEELKKALEFNEGIISAIPDLLFEIAPDGTYVGIWAQDEAMLAAQKEILLGKKFQEILPPNAVITSFQAMKEVDEKGVSLGKTYSLNLPEGKRWFELSVSKKKMSGNYIALSRDITERKKIEEQLQRSETSLKEAQRIAKMGSWELEIPTQRLTWSDETYRIFEIDQEQTGELHTIFYDSVHPDDREMVNSAFEESLKTKQPFEIVHRIVMHDGRIKYVLEGCETQYDTAGNPVLAIGAVQDITERKQAEDTIRELNTTLEERVQERTAQLQLVNTAVNSSTEAIYITDETLSILYVNDGACHMLGYSRDELTEMKVYDIEVLFSPEYFFRIRGDTLSTKHTLFETKHRTKEGRILDVEIAESSFVFNGTQIEISVVKEISERKKIEALQQERLALEEHLSKIAAAAPGVNYIFEKTVEGDVGFTYLAPGFQELFGLSTDAAKNDFALVMQLVHPDDREAIRQSIAVTADRLGEWREEFRIIHPLKGELWIEGQSSPELQPDGSIVWYGFFYDATKRKDAEEALAKSEETFRAMVENSPDVIIRYDLECRRTYINPMGQRLMGKPLEEIIGKTPSDYSPLPESVKFEKLFERVVSEGKEIELESPYRTSEGEMRIGYQRIVPELNTEGEVISVMVIGRDITEQKRSVIP